MIKTWQQRCEEHPDHSGIVTERMIQARMQEEIDELRAAIEQPRQWQGLTDDEIALICGECAASHADDIRYARAIETRLKEKNT